MPIARTSVLLFVTSLVTCNATTDPAISDDCAPTEEKARALLDEFEHCDAGDSCQVWAGATVTSAGGACVSSLACFAGIRADADTTALETRARTLLAGSKCNGCAAADCARREQVEASCDTTEKRCKIRITSVAH